MPEQIDYTKLPSPIELLVNDKVVREALYEGIVNGEEEAFANANPRNLRYHRGMEAFLKRDVGIRENLLNLGWVAVDNYGLRCFESPADRYPYQFQLMHKRGKVNGKQMTVFKIKRLMRESIRTNHRICNIQPVLPNLEVEEVLPAIPSIYCVCALAGRLLLISLAYPVDINQVTKEITLMDVFHYEPYEFGGVHMKNIPSAPRDDDDFPALIERIHLT